MNPSADTAASDEQARRPMTPLEARVADICTEILGLDSIGVDDDLYSLGVDSHQALLVALEVERIFAVDLPLEVMESATSVQDLAAWLDGRLAAREEAATPAAEPARPSGDD